MTFEVSSHKYLRSKISSALRPALVGGGSFSLESLNVIMCATCECVGGSLVKHMSRSRAGTWQREHSWPQSQRWILEWRNQRRHKTNEPFLHLYRNNYYFDAFFWRNV